MFRVRYLRAFGAVPQFLDLCLARREFKISVRITFYRHMLLQAKA